MTTQPTGKFLLIASAIVIVGLLSYNMMLSMN